MADGAVWRDVMLGSPSGYLLVDKIAAPADADVEINTCVFWFDRTSGSAKLMVKGRDDGDHIVTAAISLN